MILVSAGHHKKAQGARWGEFTEWKQATLWRDLIVRYLGDIGVAVPSTLLRDKVEFINANQAVCAIEIHFNSAKVDGHHVGRGCETLHYPGSTLGIELAKATHRAVSRHFFPNRGIKEGWYRMDRPGKVGYHGDVDGDETIDYFLKATHCPAVILEPDFIHRINTIEQGRATTCKDIAFELNVLLGHWGLL